MFPEEPGEEPRVTVDTFNTLYLTGVKSTEEGNYTCDVDAVRMQQIRVFIVSKSKLLTQGTSRACDEKVLMIFIPTFLSICAAYGIPGVRSVAHLVLLLRRLSGHLEKKVQL